MNDFSGKVMIQFLLMEGKPSVPVKAAGYWCEGEDEYCSQIRERNCRACY